ncbi:MAG: hypothetical protein VX924_04330 [Candidatus Neomarinimicrobiota bacterium]|nr:hypothetical protein [Candidatus Neomarinimicrobiota bacterium]
MISDYNRLSGLQKVAILFSVLGESLALNLVNDLDKTEIRKIRAAMRGVNNVSFMVKKQVMEEFYFSFVSEKFVQEESDEPKRPFEFLNDLTDEQLIALVSSEDSRVVAITLDNLKVKNVLKYLTDWMKLKKGRSWLILETLTTFLLKRLFKLPTSLTKSLNNCRKL